MGPITLFDKSFLQSLSLDESVWFDHFFITNVCPLFFVETLADLEKTARKGRTSEQEVAVIADKFPEMSSAPSANYLDLCISNLLGQKIPMTGQILLAHGRLVKSGGKTGAVAEPSPEADAFSRWQKREFWEIERLYARVWRDALSNLDLDEVGKLFRLLGVDGKSCRTLEEAKALAESVVAGRDKPFERMKLALLFLNVPHQLHRRILEVWKNTNYLPLTEFARYAAFVLTIEIFFQIGLAADLISSERPSNRVDIAYLFYLPFCKLFVSSDRLHRKSAPLFLRTNQEFVWGHDLKLGLRQLNDHYSRFPISIKEKGVISFARNPPKEGDFLVAHIWDRHIPRWREDRKTDISDEKDNKEMSFEEIRKMADAPSLRPDEVDFDPIDVDSVTIQRRVRRKKGSWHQVPKELDASKE